MSRPILSAADLDTLDFAKGDGLLPCIAQDHRDGSVRMLGYVSRAALEHSLASGLLTFHSRSKGRLWTKGEDSGHHLRVVALHADCDHDAVLALVDPIGPTCHLGSDSCFGEANPQAGLLARLDRLIAERHASRPEGSYTTRLFDEGTRRIAQKVGEEGVETALAAVSQDDPALLGEAADLVYHLLVLLRARGLGLAELLAELDRRHRGSR